jgi:hypothetical protein
MHIKQAFRYLPVLAFFSLLAIQAPAQSSTAASRITQPIDATKLTTLTGNTHPLARAKFDQGAVPANFSMDRMLLVLKRSPEQEAALEAFMRLQTTSGSRRSSLASSMAPVTKTYVRLLAGCNRADSTWPEFRPARR